MKNKKMESIEVLLKTQWLAGILNHLRANLASVASRDQKNFNVMAEKSRIEQDIKSAQSIYNDMFDESLTIMNEDHGLDLKCFKRKSNEKDKD